MTGSWNLRCWALTKGKKDEGLAEGQGWRGRGGADGMRWHRSWGCQRAWLGTRRWSWEGVKEDSRTIFLFSFPPGTGLQGRKNHLLVSPWAPRDALESVVALCSRSCSSHTLLEGFLSTHMHTLMRDLKRECCNEMFRSKQISRLLP